MHVLALGRRVINGEEPAMEHILRRPVESRRAYEQRRKTLAFGVVLALSVAAALAFVLMG